MSNKGFFKGMITGMVIMCLFFAGISAGRVLMQEMNGKRVSDDRKSDEEDKSEEAKETVKLNEIITSPDFIEKYNFISSYIDTLYLNKEEIDAKEVEDGIFQGLIDSLGDKYADYYNKEEYDSFMEDTQGQYGGIGTYVSQDLKTGEIVIVNPFEGAPADVAGVKSGDILVEIDGESIVGMELDEVVSIMKGEPDTDVLLGVYREDEKLDIVVTRKIVDVPTVQYEVIEEDNIGYIYISSFDTITCTQFREAVDELEKKNVDGLVIDVRNNGGGLISSVVDMLDRILPEGLVMYTETNKGREEEYFSTDEEKYEKPYVVLINEYSASASEVFAGAVQDYGYGTVIGTKSYGKGVVQSIIPLNGVNDGSAIKLTVSKYFTPNGRNIDGIGIEPDVEIELDNKKVIKKGEKKIDNQVDKAIEIIKSKK